MRLSNSINRGMIGMYFNNMVTDRNCLIAKFKLLAIFKSSHNIEMVAVEYQVRHSTGASEYWTAGNVSTMYARSLSEFDGPYANVMDIMADVDNKEDA